MHEDVHDFLYARHASAREALMPQRVLDELPRQSTRGVLRWMQRIYHLESPSKEARFVEHLLGCQSLQFYDRVMAIDVLREESHPRPEAIAVLVGALSDQAYCSYFFRDLRDPRWLPLLRSARLFSFGSPGTQDPRLLLEATGYMVAVASHCPSDVLAVLPDLTDGGELVRLNGIRALLELPPSVAVQAAPTLVEWLGEGGDVLWIREAQKLMTRLAESGVSGTALDLLGALTRLAPAPPPGTDEHRRFGLHGAKPLHDEYWVKQMLAEDVPAIAELDPWPVLELLEARLTEALTLHAGNPLQPGPTESSALWRPQMAAAAGEHLVQDYQDALLDAIVGLVIPLAKQGAARELLARYLDHRYAIFRRLALHVLTTSSTQYSDLVDELFAQPGLVLMPDAEFESVRLWQTACSEMSDSTEHHFISKLLEMAAAKESERRARLWLWACRDSGLSVEAVATLDRLIATYGEPSLEPLITFSGLVRYTSPVSQEALATKTVSEVVSLLEQPFEDIERATPTSDIWQPHSRIELARTFAGDVARRPGEYAAQIALFEASGLSSEVLYYLLSGFEEAWSQGTDFSWAPVLGLCTHLASRAEADIQRQRCREGQGQPGILFEGVHAKIAGLLEKAYESDSHAVPDTHDSAAKEILFQLLTHPDPEPGEESEAGLDSATTSLNVVRGRAMHALVRYALHRARALPPDRDEDGSIDRPPRLEHDVRTALEDRLRNDPSPAVHAVFGMYLPQLCYLDRDWILGHHDVVFDRSNLALWRAAWHSFVSFNQAHKDLYSELAGDYRLAVEDLATPGEKRAGLERADDRLATHIASAYWFGWDDLESEGSLVRLFLERAPAELRGRFDAFLRTGLQNPEVGVDSESWVRLRSLWRARLAVAAGKPQREAAPEVLAFTGWLGSVPEDLGGLRDLVAGLVPYLGDETAVLHTTEVVEYLSEQSPGYAGQAVELLIEVLNASRRRVSLWRRQIRPILEAAVRSGDERTQQLGVDAVNLLGEMGEYEYRDLLDVTTGQGSP